MEANERLNADQKRPNCNKKGPRHQASEALNTDYRHAGISHPKDIHTIRNTRKTLYISVINGAFHVKSTLYRQPGFIRIIKNHRPACIHITSTALHKYALSACAKIETRLYSVNIFRYFHVLFSFSTHKYSQKHTEKQGITLYRMR